MQSLRLIGFRAWGLRLRIERGMHLPSFTVSGSRAWGLERRNWVPKTLIRMVLGGLVP